MRCAARLHGIGIPIDALLMVALVFLSLQCADGLPPDPEDAPPILYGADRDSGIAGEMVQLSGEGFDPVAERNRVLFDAVQAQVLDVSVDPRGPDSLTTVVPAGLPEGTVQIRVEVDGAVSNPLSFFITLVPGGNFVNALYPVDVDVDPERERIFVVNRGSDSLSVIPREDEGDDRVRNVGVGKHPRSVAVDPNTGCAYTADSGDDQISRVEPDRGFRVSSFPSGEGSAPAWVGVNTGERALYVLNPGNHTVGVFSLDVEEFTHVLPVEGAPTAAAWDPSLQRLYVLSRESGVLTSCRWPGYDDPVQVEVGPSPWALCVHLASHRVYVACPGEPGTRTPGTVAVVDGPTLALLGDIPVGVAPHDVIIEQASHKVLVSNYDSNGVSVIDGETLQVTGSVQTGMHPLAMELHAASGLLLVLNESDASGGLNGSVSLVDVGRQTEIDRIGVGGVPRAMALDARSETLCVANYLTHSLSLLEEIGRYPVREDRLLGIQPGRMVLDRQSGDLVVGAWNGVVSRVRSDLSAFASRWVGARITDVAVDPARGLVYATDEDPGDEKMWVLEADGLQVVRSVPVGRAPARLLIDPGRNQAFVANANDWHLSAVDLDTYAQRRAWFWDFDPTDMALCEEEGMLYAISDPDAPGADDRLVAVHADTMNGAREIRMPSGVWGDLHAVTVDSRRHRVYVTNSGAATAAEAPSVSVLECASGEVLATVRTGRHPLDIAVRERDGRVFVANYLDDSVTVLDEGHGVVDTVPVGRGPRTVAYDPALDALFVHNTSDKTLWTLDAEDFTVRSRVQTGKPEPGTGVPWKPLLVNPETHQVWVMDKQQGGIYQFPGEVLAAE